MIKAIDKKQIKLLNDLNQIAKKVFARYYLFSDGFLIPSPGERQIKGGFHFCVSPTTQDILNIFELSEQVVYIDSVNLYKAVKDNKKVITHITIEASKIYLSDGAEQKFLIGGYHKPTEAVGKNYAKARVKYENSDKHPVGADMVESLCANNLVGFSDDTYKVRITKELVPNIKKDLPMSVAFIPVDEEDVFELLLLLKKDEVVNCHLYKCIKY